MLDHLITLLDSMAPAEGTTGTLLPEVTLFRAERHEKAPLIYDQCVCVAAQGHKTCHLSDRTFTYGPDQYLVVPTVVPVDIEVFPEGGKPLLGVTMPIDFRIVRELLDALPAQTADADDRPAPGVYLEPMTGDIAGAFLRLVRCLRDRGEAAVLGPQIIREIHYRVLTGTHGAMLASAARGESGLARIAKALRTIHDNYTEPLDVPRLAGASNMSTRSFHEHFKAVTSHTPVQYLKRIRLEKARQFLVSHGYQAGEAAHLAGYESPSHFSREFKRHFGYPPSEARHMAKTAG